MDSDAFVDRIEALMHDILAVPVDRLEYLVQEAHLCALEDRDDPPERFAVSRQALRMLWRFRRHLEAVEVIPGHD